MAVTWEVTGLKELNKLLKTLPDMWRRGVVRRALREAAKIVEADAKRRAPILKNPAKRRIAGVLRDAIRAAPMRSLTGTEVAVKVGVKKLHKTSIEALKRRRESGEKGVFDPHDPFYARFVERGTSKMAARPFMRPALEANAFAVVERYKLEFGRGIDAQFKKKLLLHKGRA